MKEKEKKKKKKKTNKLLGSIIFVMLFLFFIGVMDYPFIAQIINEYTQAKVVSGYREIINELTDEDAENMRIAAKLYNEKLASGNGVNLVDAFSGGTAGSTEYTSLLNSTDDGIMGIVSIPKIDVELPIYHGTNEYALQHGTGHLEGTSLPIGGESTHACISGHRGLPNKKIFTSLDLLEKGDVFYIQILGETLAYKVINIEEVLPSNVEPLQIIQKKDLVTLITCTPYGINTHRLFVTGERIPYLGREEEKDAAQKISWNELFRTWWWAVATVILLIIMIRMVVIYNRGPKKKHKNEEKD